MEMVYGWLSHGYDLSKFDGWVLIGAWAAIGTNTVSEKKKKKEKKRKKKKEKKKDIDLST